MDWLVGLRVAALTALATGLLASGPAVAEDTATGTIVQAFVDAGLPIDEVAQLDEATDTNLLLGRPGQYVEKIVWTDRRVPAALRVPGGVESGGTIERFTTMTDLENREAQLAMIVQVYPGLFYPHYTYTHGLMLVRVVRYLTPGQAAEYEAVLNSLP